MPLFHAMTATGKPDYVALAMVIALLLIVAVMALRKRFGNKKKTQPEVADAVTVTEEAAAKPEAPGSAGVLKLHDVEPKTAAMLMAIVAHKMGKPLNELRFLSIKEVK